MVRMMQDEIKHDPAMEQLFYQAVAEQIEVEIKLVKESKNDIQETRHELQADRDRLLCTYTEVVIALLLGSMIGFLVGVLV
jgi:hypothetical protein